MTYSTTRDDLVSCLTELLVTSRKYRITFNTHSNESVLSDFRKAKVMEITKYVDRIDKKMPLTYILEFVDFTGYLVIDLVRSYTFTHNSITLQYATYTLKLERL